MAETVSLARVEALATQLSAQDQLLLVAFIGERLGTVATSTSVTTDELLQCERAARAEAIIALCNTAAAISRCIRCRAGYSSHP